MFVVWRVVSAFSAIFINCFCFLDFCFSIAVVILFGLSLIWNNCMVVGPNLIFRCLFLFLLSSLYFLLFVFWRASILLSIVSLSRDSLLLLLLCLSSDLDLFLLVWWCDVLRGGFFRVLFCSCLGVFYFPGLCWWYICCLCYLSCCDILRVVSGLVSWVVFCLIS